MEALLKSVQYHLIPSEFAERMPQDKLVAKHVVIVKEDDTQIELDVFREKSEPIGDLARKMKKDIWVGYDGKWLGKVVSQHTIPEDQKVSTAFANIQRLQEVSGSDSGIELRMKQMTANGVFSNMRPDRREALFVRLRELDAAGYAPLEGNDPAILYNMIKNGFVEGEDGTRENVSWRDMFSGTKEDNKKLLDLVLLGVLKGELSETTASTVFTYWTLFTFHADEAYQMEEVDAFTETGEINPEAERMIANTLGSKGSEEKLAAFFAELKTLPRSEQRFVTAPLFVESDPSIVERQAAAVNEFQALPESTSQRVQAQKMYETNQIGLEQNIVEVTRMAGVNFLGVSGRTRIFAPMGMKQACLNAFTPHPVTLKPRFGAAHIEKAIEVGFRDETLRSPDQPVPTRADKYSAPGASYLEHDMYHAVLQSFTPEEHQAWFVRLAEIGDGISKKDLLTEMLEFRFYDMESNLYFADKVGDPSPSQIFWAQVAMQIAVASLDVNATGKPENLRKLKLDPNTGLTPGAMEYIKKIFEEISAVPGIDMEGLRVARAAERTALINAYMDGDMPTPLKLFSDL
jgi:hypothetical protein